MLKKTYIKPLLSIFSTGILMIVSFWILIDHSIAWFSDNGTVTSSGMHVSARGVPDTEQYLIVDGMKVEQTAGTLCSDLVPGETIEFSLYVKNNTDSYIDFQLFMQAPTENDDTPYVIDGLYHYMGTQIRINSVKNGDEELLAPNGNDRYLLTLDNSLYIGEDASLPPTAIDFAYDFSHTTDRSLTHPIDIVPNGEIILDIELEFVDNGMLQNPYIEFGASGAADPNKASLVLSRTLLCSVAYAS